jgi:hypothetical protein
MAILKSIQSGNFTDSTTWAVVDQNSYLYQETTVLSLAGGFAIFEGNNFYFVFPYN